MPRPLILVLDDDPLILEATTLVLEEVGFGVVGAPSGRHLPALCRTWSPDLILAAYDLPGPNGYELHRRLEQDADLQGIPFVVTIAAMTPRVRRDCRQEGICACMLKPFSDSHLLQTVRKYLRPRVVSASGAA